MTATKNGNGKKRKVEILALKMDYLRKDIDNLSKAIKTLHTLLDEKYVTKIEYEPYKRIIQGAVAIILLSVFGGLIALVVM